VQPQGKATRARRGQPQGGHGRDRRAPFGEAYKAATGTTVTSEFGPFGLLRERIEKSEDSALFASADMGHLLKLLRDDRSTRVPTVGDSSAALPYRPTGTPFGSAMASRPMEAAVARRGHPHMNRHQVAHPSPRDVEGAVRRSGPLSRLELECRTWRSSESAYGTTRKPPQPAGGSGYWVNPSRPRQAVGAALDPKPSLTPDPVKHFR
jgi:hypothetical protein